MDGICIYTHISTWIWYNRISLPPPRTRHKIPYMFRMYSCILCTYFSVRSMTLSLFAMQWCANRRLNQRYIVCRHESSSRWNFAGSFLYDFISQILVFTFRLGKLLVHFIKIKKCHYFLGNLHIGNHSFVTFNHQPLIIAIFHFCPTNH